MNPTVKFITRTAVLLAIALAVQFLRLPPPFGQFVTGPVVNAVLILAVAYVGIGGAALIGLITPGFAFLVGILPAPLAPVIPIIMTANLVLCLGFYFGRKLNLFGGAIIAAVLKFLTFFAALNYVLMYLGIKLPPPLLAAFQTPQLITALIGGLIAAVIISRYNPDAQ